MFASNLNGIAASVRCVSFIIVVLNAKLTQIIAAHAIQNTVRNGKARQESRFLLVETHCHLTSIAVLTVHAETGLLYTFQLSIQASRNMVGKGTHLQVIQ